MSNMKELSSSESKIGKTCFLSSSRSGIVTGLAFTGIGAIGLGAGFLTGLSKAKKKLKDDVAMTSARKLEREGAALARRALAYGSLISLCAVGSLIAIGAYVLDIRSIGDLHEISLAATLERNSKK